MFEYKILFVKYKKNRLRSFDYCHVAVVTLQVQDHSKARIPKPKIPTEQNPIHVLSESSTISHA